MKQFAQKLAGIEADIAKERGGFLLFALFLREDAPDVWDLIVAAPWIEADKAEALRYLAQKLKDGATQHELAKLSRIVIIDSGEPALSAIQAAFHVEHGVVEVVGSNFFGLQIKHAFLITSLRDQEAPLATPTA